MDAGSGGRANEETIRGEHLHQRQHSVSRSTISRRPKKRRIPGKITGIHGSDDGVDEEDAREGDGRTRRKWNGEGS